MKRIIDDYKRILDGDEYFNDALDALEKHEWNKCIVLCKKTLETSFNIEQRIAIQFIEVLAKGKDEKAVKEYLDIAYNYDR